ncbi:hypothetical protein N658DRAFT_559135 [Parathielavia hyrcaniae]|uniref:GPI inositol-deacylase winged helix domain-containing protein n=1 Tax=Parathielavia hyrcaniae TaxID=113614 RepID=A0AAN6Q011_9PEZI|nr:hypothetical protein N658DRAFT_559135 [Parathielavia hyrcaniae]
MPGVAETSNIQSYVNQRTQDWMRTANLDQEIRKQVERLLAPVTENADGMFLYARIVLDNAETCNGLEEIERELRVLPVDLNDAYHRILARISQSPPTLRRKANMILGWIGPSPIPMTRHEMEQALLVDSNSNAAPAVIATVNFVRICGPIIEVVNEGLQFVHFTVKEYIFSREVSGFIDKAEANYSLAKTLLTYLCSGAFDKELSDQKLQENIMAGLYRLHWFATSQWVILARRCVEKSNDLSAYPDFLELLTRLALELRNYSFNGQVPDLNDRVLRAMGPDRPEISQIVCGVLQFRQDDKQSDWNYTNSHTWADLDPTVISFTSTRIYERLEELLCGERKHRKPSDCCCTTLHRHYGTNIFKCSYPSCSLNRSGFPTHRARKAHPAAGQADLTQDCFSQDDLRLLLFELTRAGDVDGLRRIAPHLEWHGWGVRPALILAAKMGSLPMVDFFGHFFQRLGDYDSECFFRALVKSENPALLRWLLDRLCESRPNPHGRNDDTVWRYSSLAGAAFSTSSPELFAEWEDFLLDPARQLKSNRAPHLDHRRGADAALRELSVVFSTYVFCAVKKSALFEARLIQTWHRLIEAFGPLDRQFLGWSLNMLARSSSHSITMAAELLRLGAPIDFPRGRAGVIGEVHFSPMELKNRTRNGGKNERFRRNAPAKRHKGMTALHYASRATSEQAARFARFLLEEGADPKYGWAGVAPAEEKGAELMQKWLGESWDEVVARTKEARQKKKREEGGGLGDGSDEDEDEALPRPKRRRKARKRQKYDSNREEEDEDEQVVPIW